MTMSKYTLDQAYAIADMGRGCPEYNVGVLATIGLGEVGRTYMARQRELAELTAHLDAQAGEDAFAALLGGDTPEYNSALTRANEAWVPIQSIIDEARAIVDENQFRTQW